MAHPPYKPCPVNPVPRAGPDQIDPPRAELCPIRESPAPPQLVWVGTRAPAPADSELLHALLEDWRAGEATAADLEEYLATVPFSPWAPSLRFNLASLYLDRAQMTPALAHLELAWETTRDLSDPAGKGVADAALAHWTRQLMALGRVEELELIYAAFGDRVLDLGPLTQMFIRTHEKYLRMQTYPWDSFKSRFTLHFSAVNFIFDQWHQAIKAFSGVSNAAIHHYIFG
jgi:hypothetical protein